MYQLLFKNKFNALVFVAILLFSVRILVGTEDEKGTIAQATESFTGEPDRARPFVTEPRFASSRDPEQVERNAYPAEDEPGAQGFVPDEELVQSTEGFDPVGIDPMPAIAEPAGTTMEGNPG